jgi:hypothetical protein
MNGRGRAGIHGCLRSEWRIGFGRVVSAVAFTMRVHYAARWLEAVQLGEVMSLEPVRDVEQAVDEPLNGFVR